MTNKKISGKIEIDWHRQARRERDRQMLTNPKKAHGIPGESVGLDEVFGLDDVDAKTHGNPLRESQKEIG